MECSQPDLVACIVAAVLFTTLAFAGLLWLYVHGPRRSPEQRAKDLLASAERKALRYEGRDLPQSKKL